MQGNDTHQTWNNVDLHICHKQRWTEFKVGGMMSLIISVLLYVSKKERSEADMAKY